jgi:O-antigen ligase
VYGEFLIIVICITLVAIFMASSRPAKIFHIACFALQLINLALTYSRGCYIAALLAIFIIIWCCNKKLLWFGLLGVPAIPYVLPQNMLTRIMSVGDYLTDSSVVYRLSIWKSSLSIIKNHWYVGSGVGTTAFTAFYQQYMYPDILAQHSHNLLMQITIELSFVALILFLLLLIFTIKDVCSSIIF